MSLGQDLLSFSCPKCGVKLRVPVSMAGIEGPCPSCSAIIQAPEAPLHGPRHASSDSQAQSTPAARPTNPVSAYADPPRPPSQAEEPVSPQYSISPSSPATKSSQGAEKPISKPNHHTSRPNLEESPSHPTPQSHPQHPSITQRSAPLTEAPVPTANGPSTENPFPVEKSGQSKLTIKSSPAPSSPEDSQIHSFAAKSNATATGEPGIDPLMALKPAAIKAPRQRERERLPTNSSLPSERKSRTEKKPEESDLSDERSDSKEDLLSLESSESMEPERPPSSESASRKGNPGQATPKKPLPDPSGLESEKAVKLNVNASSVGAMVGHEHVGSLENTRRSQPTWAGMSFLLIFITLSAVMIYLVLDLSDMLPHSKSYGQLPDPVASGTSKTPSTAGETSAAAVSGANRPTEQPSTSAQSAGVFKVDPNSLFSGPLSSNQNLQPTPDTPPIIGTKNSAPEDTLGAKEVSGEDTGALLPGDPETAALGAVGALIDEQDIKVRGEVSLPPLIDLNPARNALPTQSSGPSAPSETLSLFLAARNLNERRPYMTDSRRSEAELERGPLAKELPAIVQQRLLKYMKDHSEKTDEVFFEISFERDSTAPILVQVNAGSDGRMRVHTDAFLDLYNDEMARFQAVPVKGERTFHTLADAYKQCFEEKIPGAADKSYIKLRQHEQVTARLQAYFPKDSEISQQIGQSKALPWGRSGICTVTVRWNTDYGRPYVELVRIDDLSWAP